MSTVMIEPIYSIEKTTTTIDNRILAAIERNQEYLGLTEWLVRNVPPTVAPAPESLRR